VWLTSGPTIAATGEGDTLARGIGGALQLNAVVLILFSVTAFILVYLVGARARSTGVTAELGVLRSMGVRRGRWLGLLALEGGLTVGVGLLAGVVVGLGLAITMIPYLAEALGTSMLRVSGSGQWAALAGTGWLYALLALVYLAALLALLAVLARTTAWRTPRRPEE
jgi:hypothetical protein